MSHQVCSTTITQSCLFTSSRYGSCVLVLYADDSYAWFPSKCTFSMNLPSEINQYIDLWLKTRFAGLSLSEFLQPMFDV